MTDPTPTPGPYTAQDAPEPEDTTIPHMRQIDDPLHRRIDEVAAATAPNVYLDRRPTGSWFLTIAVLIMAVVFFINQQRQQPAIDENAQQASAQRAELTCRAPSQIKLDAALARSRGAGDDLLALFGAAFLLPPDDADARAKLNNQIAVAKAALEALRPALQVAIVEREAAIDKCQSNHPPADTPRGTTNG